MNVSFSKLNIAMEGLVCVIKQAVQDFFTAIIEGVEMNQSSKQVNVKEPLPTITVNEALPATPKLTAFQIRSAKAKHALQAIRNEGVQEAVRLAW